MYIKAISTIHRASTAKPPVLFPGDIAELTGDELESMLKLGAAAEATDDELMLAGLTDAKVKRKTVDPLLVAETTSTSQKPAKTDKPSKAKSGKPAADGVQVADLTAETLAPGATIAGTIENADVIKDGSLTSGDLDDGRKSDDTLDI